MASISFSAGGGSFNINNLTGSGIGFYGSTFGNSVEVGAYQDSSWITNSAGTSQGPQINNNKWTHPNSGSLNGLSSINLTAVPNYLSTLQIQFSHTTAVKTQNAKLRIFDRSNINNAASGVLTKMAEIIHPDTAQTANGSGSTSWNTPAGSATIVSLASSPGLSGLSPNGPSTTDMTHNWYIALSASPDSIGSKTLYGAYFSVEYL